LVHRGTASVRISEHVLDPSRLAIISLTVTPSRYPSLRASPLQSSFAPGPSPSPFGSELDLPRFLPSSRLHTHASTSREAFTAPLRSVLRFSQPPDDFLRGRACELISSRCHVQGPPVQGVLGPHSHPPSSGGACPLAVARHPLTDRDRLPRLMPSASRLRSV